MSNDNKKKKKLKLKFEWPKYNEAQIKAFILDNAAAVFELYARVDEVTMDPKRRQKANQLRISIKNQWLFLLNNIYEAEYHRWFEGGPILIEELVKGQRAIKRNIKKLAVILSASGCQSIAKLFGLWGPFMTRRIPWEIEEK